MASSSAVEAPSVTSEESSDAAVDADARPGTAASIASVVMGVAWAAVALGLVVGFNQLATQSPVDAVLPVALFSVGFAGVATMLAASLEPFAAHGPDRALLEPPPAEEGFLQFGIGLVAIAAVGWRWGTVAQAAVVGACGLQQLLVAELGVVALLRRRRPEPDAVRIGLSGAVGVLLVAFAWTALADAGASPFG
jgi:cytochrome c biogenesis protein CcdA